MNREDSNHSIQRIALSTAVALATISIAQRACADEVGSRISAVTVEPESIVLVGADSLRGLLVHGQRDDGRIVAFRAGADEGAGQVEIAFGERSLSVPVQVKQPRVPHAYHFENDVVPILSKYGCNSSGCHGKAEGQNGFKLSVFGFDPQSDYDALVKQGRGRRTFPAEAGRSLLLAKASGLMPHGGGIRIVEGCERGGYQPGMKKSHCPSISISLSSKL